MFESLSFVVVVAVRMIDPISIVVAVMLGTLAAIPKDSRLRWIIVTTGAVAMTIAFNLVASYQDSLLGVRQSNAWTMMRALTTWIASSLQITFAMWLIRRLWGRGTAGESKEAV
jgi:hypothetical protein